VYLTDLEDRSVFAPGEHGATFFARRRIYLAWGDTVELMTSFAHEWGHVVCDIAKIPAHHLRSGAHDAIEEMAVALGPELRPPRPPPERR